MFVTRCPSDTVLGSNKRRQGAGTGNFGRVFFGHAEAAGDLPVERVGVVDDFEIDAVVEVFAFHADVVAGDDVGDFFGQAGLQGEMGAVERVTEGGLSGVGLVFIPAFDVVAVVEEGLAKVVEHAGGQGEIGVDVEFFAVEPAHFSGNGAGDAADAAQVVGLRKAGDVPSADHAGACELFEFGVFGFGQGEGVGLDDFVGELFVGDFVDFGG